MWIAAEESNEDSEVFIKLYAKTEEKRLIEQKMKPAFIKWVTILANENVLLYLTFTNIEQFNKLPEQEYFAFVPSDN